MKIMIDTNVVIDILQKREPFFNGSHKALYKAISENNECLVSVSAVTDIFYILRKSLHSTEVANHYIEEISKIVTFADVLSTDIDMALMRDITDFEDAVVDAVAVRIGAEMIITRNDKDFSGAKTSVVTPETYVSLTQV